MNLIEYLNGTAYYNLPELLNLHHHNPLCIPYQAQVLVIFGIVAAMGVLNYYIRFKGKYNYYPALYAMLAVSIISIFYYCFQDGLPLMNPANPESRQCIGWFCNHDVLNSLPLTIIGLAGIMIVIYNMLCAIMQATAEMSVYAGLSEGRKWKEWKWAVYISLFSVAACGFSHSAGPMAVTWTLIATQSILLIFVICKIILDCVRGTSIAWSITLGLVFYIGLVAVMMLTTECMRGSVFFFVGVLAAFTGAKARKKKPKGQKAEGEDQAAVEGATTPEA